MLTGAAPRWQQLARAFGGTPEALADGLREVQRFGLDRLDAARALLLVPPVPPRPRDPPPL
jgi:hypothetical protein